METNYRRYGIECIEIRTYEKGEYLDRYVSFINDGQKHGKATRVIGEHKSPARPERREVSISNLWFKQYSLSTSQCSDFNNLSSYLTEIEIHFDRYGINETIPLLGSRHESYNNLIPEEAKTYIYKVLSKTLGKQINSGLDVHLIKSAQRGGFDVSTENFVRKHSTSDLQYECFDIKVFSAVNRHSRIMNEPLEITYRNIRCLVFEKSFVKIYGPVEGTLWRNEIDNEVTTYLQDTIPLRYSHPSESSGIAFSSVSNLINHFFLDALAHTSFSLEHIAKGHLLHAYSAVGKQYPAIAEAKLDGALQFIPAYAPIGFIAAECAQSILFKINHKILDSFSLDREPMRILAQDITKNADSFNQRLNAFILLIEKLISIQNLMQDKERQAAVLRLRRIFEFVTTLILVPTLVIALYSTNTNGMWGQTGEVNGFMNMLILLGLSVPITVVILYLARKR